MHLREPAFHRDARGARLATPADALSSEQCGHGSAVTSLVSPSALRQRIPAPPRKPERPPARHPQDRARGLWPSLLLPPVPARPGAVASGSALCPGATLTPCQGCSCYFVCPTQGITKVWVRAPPDSRTAPTKSPRRRLLSSHTGGQCQVGMARPGSWRNRGATGQSDAELTLHGLRRVSGKPTAHASPATGRDQKAKPRRPASLPLASEGSVWEQRGSVPT